MKDINPYDPLDYKNLTASVVRELMLQGPFELPLAERFMGAGVYALFYNGPCEGYEKLLSPGCDKPVYVGKAIPAGGRKGKKKPPELRGSELYERIREHVNTISAAQNLDLHDFRARYLVVVPLWITMAERFLIEHYKPVWNTCVDGFGAHDPGKGRHKGELPLWDVLHPGRTWGQKLQQTRTREQVLETLRKFTDALPEEPPQGGAQI